MIIKLCIGVLVGIAMFMILADRFRIPYMRTSKAVNNLAKQQKEKTSSIDVWLSSVASFIARKLRLFLTIHYAFLVVLKKAFGLCFARLYYKRHPMNFGWLMLFVVADVAGFFKKILLTLTLTLGLYYSHKVL